MEKMGLGRDGSVIKMHPSLVERYTKDRMTAIEAQRLAEFIAFGPVVFQVSRLMLKRGILAMLRDSQEGMTIEEIRTETKMSKYAITVMMEASLSIGTVIVEPSSGRFKLTKTGWFLLNDPATRVNIDFNNDVNYEGWFRLEESLIEGKPIGLRNFGEWTTIYEGLSQLPEQARESWLAFDHFYSDESFDEALKIVFSRRVRTLLDVGGNTGRWAMKCVGYDKNVRVSIMDLPMQIEAMREEVEGKVGSERIEGIGVDLLGDELKCQEGRVWDVIWMSQFLDCFSEDQIVDIVRKIASLMSEETRLYIMETFWDRQRFEAAAFCLTQISLYFTAIANGNSKMYHSEVMRGLVAKAGLEVEEIIDYLGQGHSIMICKKISK